MRYIFASAFFVIFFFSACTPRKKMRRAEREKKPLTLQFLQLYTLPSKFPFKGTVTGGLSSIDYDEAKNQYYLICDDRSETNPARYYTVAIDIRNDRIDTVRLLAVTTLLLPDGGGYPARTTDPEAMRYNPVKNELVWSSEGERNRVSEINPTIRTMDLSGVYKDSFALPSNMRITPGKGPRQNGVFEGMGFTSDYKKLFVSVEEPLLEDGPRASVGDSAAWLRIIEFDTKTKSPTAQYAYLADPVPHPPDPVTAYKINGISDIMLIDEQRMLVIERAFSVGRRSCTVRVYLASTAGATDVSGISGLHMNTSFVPMKKTLVFDMDKLNRHIDNIEGVSFGPRLANGRQSLIFVADDNFSAGQEPQILLFEILP